MFVVDVSIIILRAIRTDLTGGHQVALDSSLQAQIQEIFIVSRLSHSVLLAGLLYLLRFRYLMARHRDRLMKRMDVFAPSLMYIFFTSAMALASKFHVDSTTHNRRWAESARLPLQLVNLTEALLLEVIDFRLAITKSTFDDWVRFLFSGEHLQSYHRSAYPMAANFRMQLPYTPHSEKSDVSEGIADILLEFSRGPKGHYRHKPKAQGSSTH